MDLSYLAASFVTLSLIASALYLFFRLLFARSIVSISDPINLGIALVSFYIAGSLLLPTFMQVNKSYSYVIFLIFTYIFSAALFSQSRKEPRAPSLIATKGHQLIFSGIFTALLLLNLIANQIFGVMPLFQGTQARGELGSVAIPTLVLLAPDISSVLLLVLLLTKYRAVKRLTGLGVAISVVSTILNGAKSSAFSVVFLFVIADYILHLQQKADLPELKAEEVRRRIKTNRTYIIGVIVATALIFPAYLIFLGADSGSGSSGAVENIAVRLFGGLDALAGIALQDIDITSVKDINLSEFYFFSFYKSFAFTPEFQSAGQYILYLVTGSYQFASSGLNPNSNFTIELLLSNGSLLYSTVIVIMTSAALFSIRRVLLRQEGLRIIDLVLWSLIVLSPFSQLLDGAYFFIRSYEMVAIYLVLNSILIVGRNILAGRLVYEFI